MSIASSDPTASHISAVSALKVISRYLPHNDTVQSLAIIQREAHIQHVQSHSLTLMYRGRARTIVHTARTLIFAFKLGVGWLQVWWAQAKKPSIFPLYTPLVEGIERTKDSLYSPEIGVAKTFASVAKLPPVDEVSTPSYSSHPRAITTIHALETYQPASGTETSLCCSGPQLITLFSICVITLVLIITASSITPKPKPNPTSTTAHPVVRAKIDEKPEPTATSCLNTTQSSDSDADDTDEGGTGLPSPAEADPIPVPRNRPVHAHHEAGEVASFPLRLRGGRRNVSVHWYREHARAVRGEELCEKRKRMANEDWRVRGGEIETRIV